MADEPKPDGAEAAKPVQFEGHPAMRRILLPEEWEGFSLRKEYGLIQQDVDG